MVGGGGGFPGGWVGEGVLVLDLVLPVELALEEFLKDEGVRHESLRIALESLFA